LERERRADHRFCGPRPFRGVTWPSNSRARVGRYPDTVHDQTANFLLLLGAHTGVLVVTRPLPIFRAAGQPGLDRVKVDVLDLLVVFLDGAQGAVEEPGLPQLFQKKNRGPQKRRYALPAQIPLVASGGVTQHTAAGFVLAGAAALGVGLDLIPPDAITRRQVERIQELSHRFLAFVKDARTRLMEGRTKRPKARQ